MPARWRDEDGHVYEACLFCFYQGRILHATGRGRLVEADCPVCQGRRYLVDTEQGSAESSPLDDDALVMARTVLAGSWRCPECFGYGQHVRTVEDERARTVVTGMVDCASCGGTGGLPIG